MERAKQVTVGELNSIVGVSLHGLAVGKDSFLPGPCSDG